MTIGALILRTIIFAAFFSGVLFWSRTLMRSKFGLAASTPVLVWVCMVMVGIASLRKIVEDAWVSVIFGLCMIVVIWLGIAVDKYKERFRE
jgi:hypothetical protein